MLLRWGQSVAGYDYRLNTMQLFMQNLIWDLRCVNLTKSHTPTDRDNMVYVYVDVSTTCVNRS